MHGQLQRPSPRCLAVQASSRASSRDSLYRKEQHHTENNKHQKAKKPRVQVSTPCWTLQQAQVLQML